VPGKMTAKKRRSLPKSSFGVPSKRKYPLDTKGRARNALARVAQHGTPAEKKAVRSKVKRRYPGIKQGK
jgi:hypothetical protein